MDAGTAQTGIIAAETYDEEIIEKIYKPYDNLSLLVIMNPDGTLSKRVIASVCEALAGDPAVARDWARLKEIFRQPSLQMASFTITEKGYGLTTLAGELMDVVKADMRGGPEKPSHAMAKAAALVYERYKNGAYPIALVSMDNCSHNGERLRHAVTTIAKGWVDGGLVDKGFLSYIGDETKVSFPWSMIDKITPRPSNDVKAALDALHLDCTEAIRTKKNTFIAPFVNAEGAQYLVIEDGFPNGRPPLQKAGVYFTDRDTVNNVEKMKVCTCLNPLHTALAVYGCLLGFNSIAAEMKDAQLKKLVEKIGYSEGLPVVVNPGIMNPKDFIDEVLQKRFPNPFIPDTPQRIATDTSQKVGIRFGETIKAYRASDALNPADLQYIPLAIAGWCRYLLGLDDNGDPMPLSPDPMLDQLTAQIAKVRLGDPFSVGAALRPILSNQSVFGLDLYSVGLGEKIEDYFGQMIAGPGAVRATLVKYC